MSSKNKQVSKAKETAQQQKKGITRRKYKVRTNLRFFRPKTLMIASKPKFARSKLTLKMPSKFDKNSVLIHPLNTERSNKTITERNTITMIVHPLANKIQIKNAFKEIFNVKPKRVNTLVRADGKKKAFITLRPEDEAISIGSKMNLI